MKKRKIIIVIALIIAIVIIGKISFEVYDIYSNTTALNNEDVKKVITEDISGDVENFEILDMYEEDGYVAYLITYTQYDEDYVACSYFEPNNIIKSRYYLEGGARTHRGELGEYSIGEVGKERIVVFGLDLPDNAKQYCLDFFEQNTQVIGEIKDNKAFRLFVIEDDVDYYINCDVKLLDGEYKEVR